MQEEQVYLPLILVPVVEERRLPSRVEPALADLRKHVALEKLARHGPAFQRLGRFPPEQPGGQAGVQHVEQRHFGNPLEQVAAVGLHQGYDAGGSQERQPFLGRGRADARLPGQFLVDHGPGGTGRDHREKVEKSHFVCHLGQSTDVPFQIGGRIRRVKAVPVRQGIHVQGWHGATVDAGEKFPHIHRFGDPGTAFQPAIFRQKGLGRPARKLRGRQAQHGNDPHPPGQGFADRPHQVKGL